MKSQFQWDPAKNQLLISERGISFNDIVSAIDNGQLLNDIVHPNVEKYPHQRILMVLIDNYVYMVPFVQNEGVIFLKTAFPSRKWARHYLGE